MEFTAAQAARVTGCSISQVRYWSRIGLVAPDGPYSFRHLVALRLVRSLLGAGLSLQRIRKAVEFLEATGEDLAGLRLVTDGSKVLACHDDGEVLDALRGGQLALFVSVDAVVREVDSGVLEFSTERSAFVDALQDPSRQEDLG